MALSEFLKCTIAEFAERKITVLIANVRLHVFSVARMAGSLGVVPLDKLNELVLRGGGSLEDVVLLRRGPTVRLVAACVF